MLEVRTYVALAALVVFGQSVFADQVTLSNGDRLTGTILKSDDKALVLKTEFAGEVTVQWSAITEINSAQPLHVALKSGQTLVGGMKTADGQIEVEPANRQPVPVSKDAISSLRSESEEVAYEHSLHPRLFEGWVGGVDLGFALTRGNSETQNLNLAFIADRKTTRDHIGLYTNSVFASNDEPGAVPGTTAESTQGGARYDRNFAARGFGFGAADFETDALQSLDLRSVFSGGLGLARHQNIADHARFSRRAQLHPRELFQPAAQSCGHYRRRGTGAQVRCGFRDHRKALRLPRSESNRRISCGFQPGDGDQVEQVAGLAERFWRYLRDQSSGGKAKE